MSRARVAATYRTLCSSATAFARCCAEATSAMGGFVGLLVLRRARRERDADVREDERLAVGLRPAMQVREHDDGKLEPFRGVDRHDLDGGSVPSRSPLPFLLFFIDQPPQPRGEIVQRRHALLVEPLAHAEQLVDVRRGLNPA